MSTLTIKTNNRPRDLQTIWDFSIPQQVKIRKQFDYYSEEELEELTLFSYRDTIYNLNDFMRMEGSNPLKEQGWEGYSSDTYFSGVCVRFTEDNEQVIVGTYYS